MASLFFWASACPASARPSITVPATITRQFMLILLWLSRQPGQDGLGLSHDLLDHLTGGLDHVDQPRRLPAGRAPVLHVPQLPGAAGRLAPPGTDLAGERLDLLVAPPPGPPRGRARGRPPPPRPRESVRRHPPPPESARARPPAPYAPRPRAPGRSPHPPRWPRGPWLASRSRRAPSPSSRADAPRRSPAPDSRARRPAPARAPPASPPPSP